MPDRETQNTESVQAVLDSFRSVWERVEGTALGTAQPHETAAPTLHGSVPPSCGKELIDLINATDRAAMYDRALACRCRGGIRTMLLEHAAQASHRAGCLRGELFVRTGERHLPPESCPRLGDTLSALREGMLRDEASAKAYRRAAERSDGETLRCALERFAREADAAAADKRQRILRSFR